MGVDYTIISKPDKVTFVCPSCGEDIKLPFTDVDFNTDYWGDGGWATCPECDTEVELDNYEYD